jgi:4-amino-4-deoxychorismate lyase
MLEGCRQLAIPCPDLDTIRRWVAARTPTHGRAVVKLIVTRGSGARGYRPLNGIVPNVIVGTAPWPEVPATHYTDGITMITCETRLGENPKLAGIKHLCRLEQVMAQLELIGRVADEGLLLSMNDRVISATSSNLFAIYGSTVRTPRLDRCGVRGIARKLVLESCEKLGLAGEEGDMGIEAIRGADEVFVTNSVVGIRPVRQLDGQNLTSGAHTRLISKYLACGGR